MLGAIGAGTRKQGWAQSSWLPDIETTWGQIGWRCLALKFRALAVRAGLRGHRHHYQGIALMNG
jgi:hypothetical protein